MLNKLKFIVLVVFFGLKANAQCDDSYGSIVISEVYFDTQYNENIRAKFHSFGEYIELYNSSTSKINLEGWKIKDNHTEFTFTAGSDNDPNTFSIYPGGYKIITYNGFYANGRDGVRSGEESHIGGREKFIELFPEAAANMVDIVLQDRIVLDNDVDKISLYNPSGRLVSEVSYKNGSGSDSYTNPNPFDYMHLNNNSYTVVVSPPISNAGTGYYQIIDGAYIKINFNWPIGYIPSINPDGSIMMDEDKKPILEPAPAGNNLKQAIYLKDENKGYYSDHLALVYNVATATPFTLPYTITLKTVDPLLLSSPEATSARFNSTEAISYDIKTGQPDGQSKMFFDDLGKPTVSLFKDFALGTIWGTETVYDSFGRQSKESFPTTSCPNFNKVDFLTDPVAKSTFLDNYYSNSNTAEPYQATAQQPYSEINYDTLNPGNVINVVGGNQIGGQWKTGYSYTVPAAQEMYYVFGYDFFDGPVSGGVEEIQTRFYKSVAVDASGVENVVFSDGEGKVLASARAGSSNSIQPYPVYSLIGTQGFVDVHIPSGIETSQIVLLGSAALYDVFDLRTGQAVNLTSGSLVGGNAYRVAAKVAPLTDPKVYLTQSSGALSPESGALGISYSVNYYDYAINVYDKTGRLSKAIQPNGFREAYPASPALFSITAAPSYLSSQHFASWYSYNTLGQIEQAGSADGGMSSFAYRTDGQIRYSQSALQAPNKVSYTNYDSYGRPIESGVVTGSSNIWSSASASADVPATLQGLKTEMIFTIYDYAENKAGIRVVIPPSLSLETLAPDYTQQNLSGNVAITYNVDRADDIVGGRDNIWEGIQAITWYSYDVYGRAQWMVQYNRDFGVKTIDYEYDYRGNISKVLYQKNVPTELFVHRYSYDINNVVTQVETSRDNQDYTLQAEYAYYQSGELKRLHLVQAQQGLDYVYTLGGMLKSINHPSLEQIKDPGHDANDVFGLVLDYYDGDYIRSGSEITTSPSIPGLNQDSYNGNIKAVRFANKLLDFTSGTTADQKAYTYSYDRNNWLTRGRFSGTDNTGIIGAGNILKKKNFFEGGITYDPNGNIQTLVRTDNTDTNADATVVDQLSYNYTYAGKNQLNYVNDAISSTADPSDIENQGAGNYVYDDIGQMVLDRSENLTYAYNTFGLVTQISKALIPLVKFYYNERGQRIRKESFSGGQLSSTTYYVLDLAGNVMSNYYKPAILNAAISQTELPIYGTGRLGVYMVTHGTDYMDYQIADHLGNVRAVVKKMVGGGAPVVASYADYYPFGEQLPGRNTTGDYRYTFQGQEKDPETGKEAFQLRLWDGRLGRWLSPDPMGQHFSPYQGMGNNPISSIDPDGGWESWFGAFWHNLWNGGSGEIFQSESMGDWGIRYENTITDDGFEYHITYGGQRYDNNSIDLSLAYTMNEDGQLLTYGIDGGPPIFQNYDNRFEALATAFQMVNPEAPFTKTETVYRAMSVEAAETFKKTGKMPAGSETFVSPSMAYASKYKGVLHEIKLKPGTMAKLASIGARNEAALHTMAELPIIQSPWMQTTAFFKMEGGIMNVGLGNGAALDIFNSNISYFSKIPK